jgi:hypothetical protein
VDSAVRKSLPLLDIEVQHLPHPSSFHNIPGVRTSDNSVGVQLKMKERAFWMSG